MARKRALTDEQLAMAAEKLARGAGTRASLAAELGVSAPGLAGALRRWAGEKKGGAPKVSASESAPESFGAARLAAAVDDAPDAMTEDEQRAWYSRVVRHCETEYDRLTAQGDSAEARKILDAGIKASTALQRLNRRVDGDVYLLAREDLITRRERVLETLAAYLRTTRPLLCAHCEHELSVSWGRESRGDDRS